MPDHPRNLASDVARSDNRVAVVTGASRGIGRATAVELSARGWRVALVARNEGALREAAAACAGETVVVSADVSRSVEADRIVGAAIERFGQVDALVSNAGVAPLVSVERTTDEIWRDTIDTNLSAAFFLARACWPFFLRAGKGVIVNVSSVAARDPFDGFLAYGAAKAGLNTLTLSLAREGAKHGIRAHAIAPGATDTAMFRSIPEFAAYPEELRMEPAEVARVIAQCVDGDLRHTSGEVIYLYRRGG